MTTQNQSEKDHRSATASPADADAQAEAPAEIVQELTDEELRSVSGGTHQAQMSGLDEYYKISGKDVPPDTAHRRV
jgi:bacteriocin-like protein